MGLHSRLPRDLPTAARRVNRARKVARTSPTREQHVYNQTQQTRARTHRLTPHIGPCAHQLNLYLLSSLTSTRAQAAEVPQLQETIRTARRRINNNHTNKNGNLTPTFPFSPIYLWSDTWWRRRRTNSLRITNALWSTPAKSHFWLQHHRRRRRRRRIRNSRTFRNNAAATTTT